MKVLAKKPGTPWYTREIDNSLGALQAFVQGYIETVTIARGVCVICNEEGRLRNLPFCCKIASTDFVGNVLVVGTDGEEFCDLPISLEVWSALLGE